MNITLEEILMYQVMKAVYDSGIPVSFKGSMVLKACLIEAGYPEETRHTVDIDANWFSEIPPSKEQMVESLQNAIEKSGIDLKVNLFRMYSDGRSAGFELKDGTSGEVIFTLDMDINRPVSPTKIYEVDEFRFRGAAPIQMIADKVETVSTDKVFRRIKDVVDLYYLSKVFVFDRTAVIQTIKNNKRKLGNFHGFLCRYDELMHSYEKFRVTGDVSKPPFEDVYQTVKTFIKDIIPKNRDLER